MAIADLSATRRLSSSAGGLAPNDCQVLTGNVAIFLGNQCGFVDCISDTVDDGSI